jgi:ketopantoate reductase
MMQNSLIYGGGAIGSFLAACLLRANHKVFFLCRKKNYKKIKSEGLNIKVYNNSFLKKKFYLKNSNKFVVIEKLDEIKNEKIHNIFITTKINQSLKKIFKNIESYINKKTLIITPCTSIPFWWYKCLNQKLQKKIDENLHYLYLKNINRKNLVGMTMWLSGKVEKPGSVIISHIQRGFPIKEVFTDRKKQVNKLRSDLKKTTLSPKVNNIFSEIFIKSLNSLAFNMIAIKYEQNNRKLKGNKKAITEISNILNEGDKILIFNKIKIFQSSQSRINQTLKSKNHTMSMLNALKNNKEIELKFLWLNFKKLSSILKYKMKKTERIYKSVEKKINEYF